MKLPTRADLAELRETLVDMPTRVRTGARVASQSGLVFAINRHGLRALVASIGAPRNPTQIFKIHAANSPDKPAIQWHDRSLSFGQLVERMNRAAAGLQRRGFQRNTSVVLMMKNRPEFLEMQGGTGTIGAAGVSISWRSTPSELVYLADHCGAQGHRLRGRSLARGAAGEEGHPGRGDADFIAVGGDVPGCARYEEDLLAAPSVADPRARRATRTRPRSSSTRRARRASPRAPCASSRRTPCPRSLRFIAETPMRVDDVHLVDLPALPLDGVRASSR